jgi:acetoin utilization protein AcuB
MRRLRLWDARPIAAPSAASPARPQRRSETFQRRFSGVNVPLLPPKWKKTTRMTIQPVIASVMTREPLAVESSLGVKEAQKIMIDNNFRHLPVVEGERPVGVVSDRDILLAQLANQGLEGELVIGDLCSLDPYIVPPDTALVDVLETMVIRHIGSALVQEEGKLVGIYTATDACRDLAGSIRDESLLAED